MALPILLHGSESWVPTKRTPFDPPVPFLEHFFTSETSLFALVSVLVPFTIERKD